jgi:glycosyltransferase involved in cell wall biosynthesis
MDTARRLERPHHGLLSHLDDAQFERLSRLLKLTDAVTGSAIVVQGVAADSMFFVVKGTAQLVRYGLKIGLIGLGDAFAEPVGDARDLAAQLLQRQGVPVVGVAEGGVRETVIDGETGFLVGSSPAAIADKVAVLLDDDALARRLGSAARMNAQRRWSHLAATDRIEQALQRFLGTYGNAHARRVPRR